MAITVVNLTFANNQPWRVTFNLSQGGQPWDISGSDARMQLRTEAEDDVPWADFSSAAGTLIVETNSVTLDVPQGIAYGIRAGTYVFDMLLTPPGAEAVRVMEGSVVVKQGVTR